MSSITVLIVEDHPVLLSHFLSIANEIEGIKVDGVSTRDLAIEKINANKYDIALIDIMLSEHSQNREGLEVIKELIIANINTYILAISGTADISAAVDCYEMGVRHFLQKAAMRGKNEIKDLIQSGIDYTKEIRKSKSSALHQYLPSGIEDCIDTGLLAAFNQHMDLYIDQINKRNYKNASEIAGSLYDLCNAITSSLNPTDQRNIYQKMVALTSYWKLNRDLYAAREDMS